MSQMDYCRNGSGIDSSELIPLLPSRWRHQDGFAFPRELIGATIKGFGTLSERKQGGILVIDYLPKRARITRRLELVFNELGMWIYKRRIRRSYTRDEAGRFVRANIA